MIFYSLLFIMIIIHAVYFNNKYQKKYRQWGIAIILSLFVSLFLYFLNDPQNNVDTIKKFFPETNEFLQNLYNAYLYPEKENILLQAQWSIHSKNVALGLLIFGGIPLLWVFFVALAFKKQITNFNSTLIPKQIKNRYRIFYWIENYHLLLFLSLAAIFTLPINLFAVDWSRYLYMAWWGITIVFIYLVWNIPPTVDSKKQRSKKTKSNLLPLTCVCFILSYVYGGASLNVSHISTPFMFTCQKFCIPLLTVNPLGQFFSNTIFLTLTDQLMPVRADASNIRKNNIIIYDTIPYNENKLFFPKTYQGKIYEQRFTLRMQSYLVTFNYEAEDIPDIMFFINGQVVSPTKQTHTQIQWKFSTGHLGVATLNFQTTGGSDFSVTNISIENIK